VGSADGGGGLDGTVCFLFIT
jgi:hypothetical protein